jgi:hypothetical protein
LADYFGIYNGTMQINATYGLGRNGSGVCIQLEKWPRESIMVSVTPYINLASASFSVESWINPSTNDNLEQVIFGQCPVLGMDECMRTSLNGNGYLAFLFYGDTQTGSRIVPANSWSHAAYVYNVTAKTMSLYLNGTLDTSGSSHGPFNGNPSPLEIGNIVAYNPYNNLTFDGCIDEIWFYPFARTAAEIAATFALG